ncbi:UNVERIFIED_CONTAM: hypothetical protein K2H54_038119 [Gekko kuhli]
MPRLERFPPLGRSVQHTTDAATATVSDDPWRCPTMPYPECGSMHRARVMHLWTEKGNAVGEHRVLQTPFGPHLLCTLVIWPKPARWAMRPPQRCILAGARGAQTIAWFLAWRLATQEAVGDEGTEADSDTGGEARDSSGTTKAAVACRCRDLEQEAARRGWQRYQAALRRTLAAEDILARAGHIYLNRWRRDVAVVRQEERHRREQCR